MRDLYRRVPWGWVPAALVLVLAVLGLHYVALVSARDIVVFLGYVLGWLVLPGTLAWRAIERRGGPRPLVADLSIGLLCGYVLEFPVYLACLAAGHPHAYVLWPVLVVLATVTHARGRALWTRRTTAMPTWWSWTLASVLVYVIAWWTWSVWRRYPSSGPRLRWLYGDMYHHLMLSSELRFHFRPQNPDVLGEPLYYHWLVHLHVAASSWATGIEPVVLLQSLAPPTLCVAVFVALACVTVRLSGARWAGAVAPLLLVVGPSGLSGWNATPSITTGVSLLDVHFALSPSAGFVFGPLLVGLLLCLEILVGRLRGPAAYGFTTLCFIAMLGSKSVSLPIVLCGLLLTVGLLLVSERRLHLPALALTVLAVLSYAVAKPFFFGSGTGGVLVELLGGYGPGPIGLRLVPATVVLLGTLSVGGPLVVAVARRRTRSPDLVLLLGTGLAGYGAMLVTLAEGYSQFYFAYAALLPLALGSGLALPRLLPTLPGDRRTAVRVAASILGVVVAVAIVGRSVVWLAAGTTPPASGAPTLGSTVRSYVLPNLVILVVAAVVALLWWLGPHRRLRAVAGATAVSLAAIVGIGAISVTDVVTTVASQPATRPDPAQDGGPLVGIGGVGAARWLRARSTPDTLVATNAHCERPDAAGPCIQRNFWMAGFSERRFLVEGWSYIVREYGHTSAGPFWDEELLHDNDAAFLRPRSERLALLHEKYGVQWLFVDKRYPVDLPALERIVAPVHSRGDYVIFDLRHGIPVG